MEVISGARQSGKTTYLIERSAETGAVIICLNMTQKQYIIKMARKLNLEIPDPVIFSSHFGGFRGLKKKFLVDDAEKYIKSFFDDFGIEVDAATVNTDYILNPEF